MLQHITILVLAIICTVAAHGQQLGRRVLSPSGGVGTRLSWTLGQIETKRLTAETGMTLSQGYQQNSAWPGANAVVTIQNCAGVAGSRVTSAVVLTRGATTVPFGPSFLRLTVGFNASLLYLESVSDGASILSWRTNEALDSSWVELQVPVHDQMAAEQVLSTLTFVVGLGSKERTPLDIVSITPTDRNIGIRTVDGEFTLLGVCRDGGDRFVDVSGVAPLLQVLPNPITPAGGRIRYRIAEDAHTAIALYSYDGRLVATVLDASLTAGDYEMPFPVSTLANGLYILTLQSANTTLTSTVSVQR